MGNTKEDKRVKRCIDVGEDVADWIRERAKKNLEEDIEACLAEDSKDAKGEALRDIRWFRATWPSEAKKYDESFKRLSADPEAKAAEAALLKPKKRR